MSEDSKSGVLLITGCRDYVQGGRKKTVKEHELIQTCCHTPTRIKELNDIKVRHGTIEPVILTSHDAK